jgi:hypothetical protein
MQKTLTMTLVLMLFNWWAFSAESLLTVRVGEQDSCVLTGTTKVENRPDGSLVRFDLKGIPAASDVKRAVLRLWVDGSAKDARRHFSIEQWNADGFDGLKIWQEGGPETPLAVSFPFAFASPVCHEWDVTAAVCDWMARPAGNRGLRTNFPLPGNDSQPAWQRPYLEITLKGENPDRPKQPSQVRALYRSGQVFLTWKQVPFDGPFFDSTYRVYQHDEPITAQNLDRARLLGEVNKNSQLNYRRTVFSRDGMGSYAGYIHFKAFLGVEKTKDMTEKAYWDALLAKVPTRYNFVIDDNWPQQVEGGKWLADAGLLGEGLRELKGPELADDQGLFVHTVDKPGRVHFAVTSVVRGNENRQDFLAGNATAEPLAVKVDAPRPVLQIAFCERVKNRHPRHIREYVYWGGGPDGLHVEPSTPFYFRTNPPLEMVGLAKAPAQPAWVSLESWWSHGGATVVTDAIYVPPTRLAPFPPRTVPFSRGGWREGGRYYFAAAKGPDENPTWGGQSGIRNLFGYYDRMNTGKDPRQATVRPYLENRALMELEHFFQEFPKASRDHVVMVGEGTSLRMAVHHPEIFAFCSAAQEATWKSPMRAHEWLAVGKPAWGLKTDQGHNVWDWNDPAWLSQKFPERAWPFISHCMSDNYDTSDQRHWGQSGYPEFYLAMAAQRRGGGWWWCDIGDAPHGKWVHIPRNQAYLAFTNVNFAEKPQKDWRKEPRGTLNGYLVWHRPEVPFAVKGKTDVPLDMLDTAQRFEVAVRIGDQGLTLNGQSVPPTTARYGQADITLWRLQQFKVEKGAKYLWTNRKVAGGQLLQAGVVEADQRGLITVPGFCVDHDPAGNKLVLEPAGSRAVPTVDSAAQVGSQLLAEYLRQCRNPVLFPPVQGLLTKFPIAEFTAVRGGNPDGSITYKGGSFANVYDTIVNVEQPGPYVIAARAKGEFGAAWPLLTLEVGGKYGQRMETKTIDTTDWASYCWYADLPAGKLPIRLTAHGDYYVSPVLPALGNKRLHVAELSFARADEAKAKQTAVELRVAPRRVTVPAGMPIRCTATALSALGQPMDAPVAWTCSAGATIDAQGRFQADRPGEYAITAKAAGITGTAPIEVRDRFLDDFNCGGDVLRFWSAGDLSAARSAWYPPAAGHTFLNSLWQHKPEAKAVLLWDHGTLWTDYAVQADVFLTPSGRGEPFRIGQGRKLVHGLAARAADKDNHYRLEIERRDDRSQARLVKRVNGAETVLATSDNPPSLAPFDWQRNPMCPGWHGLSQVIAEERGLHQWRMDRMRLAVAGDRLHAWINGQAVFPSGVKDADLKTGTAGLYAEGKVVFDNVEVVPFTAVGGWGRAP